MNVRASEHPNVFNIPAGVPFARTLAQKLLQDTQDTPKRLTQIQILLPTRRACRIMADAFLSLSEGKPLLLPKLQAIGNIDEEELSLSIAGQDGMAEFLHLKPSLSPLRRQLLLAKLIMSMEEFTQGIDHAIRLSDALAQLMDQIYTEGLSFKDLEKIVPDDFADHWQITLDFLKILSEHWPRILDEQNVLDVADRREQLIRTLTNFWETHPPQTQIIAAGTTGSIPATADLLRIVSRLPNGCVVLPGFDADVDEQSWNHLSESHPQFGFKKLFERMDVQPKQIAPWPYAEHAISKNRRDLAHELMRPSETTAHWQSLSENQDTQNALKSALENLNLFECFNEREEAETIGVIIRETLETPNKTVTLVTPDRTLAGRVSALCQRWNIAVDDSAGQSLAHSILGQFFMHIGHACCEKIAPIALLSLCKHELFHAEISPEKRHFAIQQLEKHALRGLKPAPGFESVRLRLLDSKKPTKEALDFLEHLEERIEPLMKCANFSGPQSFKSLLKAHLGVLESLASRENANGADILWRSEIGDQAAKFFSDLLEQAALMPDIRFQDYLQCLATLSNSINIRTSYGLHPRVRILGQIEARLIDADVIIMGGLNEGSWPSEQAHDPWMSRMMRKNFGLPSNERSLGLAAHDFVQGFCAPHTVMTRAMRVEGVPSVPARWLQRLDAVLSAAELDKAAIAEHPHRGWAKIMDQPDTLKPAARPAPKPPIHKRPKQLSVTQVETFMQDPYAVYARHVLGLRKLDQIEKPIDAADKGNLLHNILDRFITENQNGISEASYDILINIAKNEVAELGDSASWEFWWPRFERLANWFLDHEQNWQNTYTPLKTESLGALELHDETGAKIFTLTAKADRIDTSNQGAAILDYKSGGAYSLSALKTGLLPQLPLEALILSGGGFEDVPQSSVNALAYLVLTGGQKPGEFKKIEGDLNDLISQTRTGLKTLITCFADEKTPYISLPNPERIPRYSDYTHLARVKEWSVLSDDSLNEAA